jgi:hypothetical protein
MPNQCRCFNTLPRGNGDLLLPKLAKMVILVTKSLEPGDVGAAAPVTCAANDG